ncbi:MAG TPA: calcium-binding protein [Actinomycetota bacterium]|nr:calcium-binding protein [Actinomycetota bacterium]
MRKGVFRILLLVALISGLTAYAATPASAAPPFDTQNFLPDDTNIDPTGTVLSDKFDGTDTRAHLTNVSTADTDFVNWYVCNSDFEGGGPTLGLETQDLAGNCELIGTDAEGRRPLGGNAFAPTDEAYEFFWDIPGVLDLRTRDILALACTGAAGSTVVLEGPNQNCTFDLEEDVVLDDAQSGGDATIQTSAAEMVSICTSDVDAGPGAGTNDVCEVGGTGAGTNEQVAARFRPFPHGANVPNDGFVLRVTTDAETDILSAGIESPGDAQNDPNMPFFSQTICNNLVSGVTSNVFECVFTDAMVPDNAEFAVLVWDWDDISGSGLCDVSEDGTQNPGATIGNPNASGADFTRCKLDVHYAVSGQRTATTVGATFVGTGPGGPTPPAGTCTPADTEETNQLGQAETVRFCVTDQFGDPFVGQVTLESTGPEGSGFTACPGGTLHDHDQDGRFEHCHTTTGTNGTAQATINNTTDTFQTATPGDQVVTACVDPQATAPAPPTAPPAGHGCADQAANQRATLTKHWVTAPLDVELVFNVPGANPQDLCLTGDKFRENQVGDTDELLACTFDASGNFVSTQPAGNGRLQWFIAPSGGGELTATRFTGAVPNETGNDGTATTTIEAFRQGNDIITVCLQNDPGGNAGADCASVQKRVTQTGGGGEVPTVCATNANAIVGTQGDDVLVGTQGDDVICGLGGDDVISGEAGNDLILAGAGNDTARGGSGFDSIRGGSGDDALVGGGGKDVLRGGAGNDSLKGNKFHDTLRGGGGNDELRGGRGNDINNGGDGTDVCIDRYGDNVFRNCETLRS